MTFKEPVLTQAERRKRFKKGFSDLEIEESYKNEFKDNFEEEILTEEESSDNEEDDLDLTFLNHQDQQLSIGQEKLE